MLSPAACRPTIIRKLQRILEFIRLFQTILFEPHRRFSVVNRFIETRELPDHRIIDLSATFDLDMR